MGHFFLLLRLTIMPAYWPPCPHIDSFTKKKLNSFVFVGFSDVSQKQSLTHASCQLFQESCFKNSLPPAPLQSVTHSHSFGEIKRQGSEGTVEYPAMKGVSGLR